VDVEADLQVRLLFLFGQRDFSDGARAFSATLGRVFTLGLQFDDVEKRVLRLAVVLSTQLRELRGPQASNSFYRLR